MSSPCGGRAESRDGSRKNRRAYVASFIEAGFGVGAFVFASIDFAAGSSVVLARLVVRLVIASGGGGVTSGGRRRRARRRRAGRRGVTRGGGHFVLGDDLAVVALIKVTVYVGGTGLDVSFFGIVEVSGTGLAGGGVVIVVSRGRVYGVGVITFAAIADGGVAFSESYVSRQGECKCRYACEQSVLGHKYSIVLVGRVFK